MMRTIVIHRTDGQISVMTLIKDDALAGAIAQWKDGAYGHLYQSHTDLGKYVTSRELPDRALRANWRFRDGQIVL